MRLFFLVFLSGCGFLGQEPFGETRLPDVAPWQDIGPVTFCDGTTRIAIPSEPTLGTCGGPPSSCTGDGDCASRERCICGQCVRSVCETNDQCRADQLCTFVEHICDRPCNADGDCKEGEACVPGQHVCRGSCGQTSDCQSGERCDLTTGVCKPQTCADSSTCGGRTCTIERMPASLARPFARVDGDRVILWLDRDGAPARASSTDGLTFVFEAADPRPDQGLYAQGGSLFLGSQLILSPDQVGSDLWKDVDALDAPFFDDQQRLWFAGHGVESGPSSQFGTSIPTPPNWSIGVALTADGQTWLPYPFDPAFSRTLDFTQHPSEMEPTVVSFGGSQLLYYRRAAADGTASENLAVARNPPR
jgi:hypothetical protein